MRSNASNLHTWLLACQLAAGWAFSAMVVEGFGDDGACGVFRTVDAGRTFQKVAQLENFTSMRFYSPLPHGAVVVGADQTTLIAKIMGAYSTGNNDTNTLWTRESPFGDVGTLDAGLPYRPLPASFEGSFRHVAFSDAVLGAAVGELGNLYTTEDGGRTWEQLPMNKQQSASSTLNIQTDLNSVSFCTTESNVTNSKALRGYAVGNVATLLSTTDGGRSWAELSIPFNYNLYDLALPSEFEDCRRLLAVGDDGLILWSNNGGVTWTQRSITPGQVLLSVAFSSLRIGVAVGTDALIMRSITNGIRWNTVAAPPGVEGETFAAVAFDGPVGVIAARTRLLYSKDSGESWELLVPLDVNHIQDVHFQAAPVLSVCRIMEEGGEVETVDPTQEVVAEVVEEIPGCVPFAYPIIDLGKKNSVLERTQTLRITVQNLGTKDAMISHANFSENIIPTMDVNWEVLPRLVTFGDPTNEEDLTSKLELAVTYDSSKIKEGLWSTNIYVFHDGPERFLTIPIKMRIEVIRKEVIVPEDYTTQYLAIGGSVAGIFLLLLRQRMITVRQYNLGRVKEFQVGFWSFCPCCKNKMHPDDSSFWGSEELQDDDFDEDSETSLSQFDSDSSSETAS